MKSGGAKGEYWYYRCGRGARLGRRPELGGCDNRANVREDVLRERVQRMVAEALRGADEVLEEAAARAMELAQEQDGEEKRLMQEISSVEGRIRKLTALLVDGEVAAGGDGARRVLARQLHQAEEEREEISRRMREAAGRAVMDAGKLMRECRRSLDEAVQRWAQMATPAEVNRFVAEELGPVEVVKSGLVRPLEGEGSGFNQTAPIAGAP
jgi:hypothetical protein